jgi:DNA-binding GntR family transcriptional regulator
VDDSKKGSIRCHDWIPAAPRGGPIGGDHDVTTQGDNALVDDLAARIRAKIMSGEIPIGAPLRQADLASQFGISRTPVREALRQLQTGGLIEVVPNRGARARA